MGMTPPRMVPEVSSRSTRSVLQLQVEVAAHVADGQLFLARVGEPRRVEVKRVDVSRAGHAGAGEGRRATTKTIELERRTWRRQTI